MKYVYVVETSDLNRHTNRYSVYRMEVFSSLKKAQSEVAESIKVNKGYDIETTDFLGKNADEVDYFVDYKCLNSDGKEMKVRYRVRKKEVR